MRTFTLVTILVVAIFCFAELAADGGSSGPTTTALHSPASICHSLPTRTCAARLRRLAHTELKGGRLAIARRDPPQAAFWMKQARETIGQLREVVYGSGAGP